MYCEVREFKDIISVLRYEFKPVLQVRKYKAIRCESRCEFKSFEIKLMTFEMKLLYISKDLCTSLSFLNLSGYKGQHL